MSATRYGRSLRGVGSWRVTTGLSGTGSGSGDSDVFFRLLVNKPRLTPSNTSVNMAELHQVADELQREQMHRLS